jgi:glyoxylase-like metal-dependent hydrolase (beta-lactamase superfamily II)
MTIFRGDLLREGAFFARVAFVLPPRDPGERLSLIIRARLSVGGLLGEMVAFDVIDTRMHGYERITGAFLLRAEKTALIETGPKSSVDEVFASLDSMGVTDLDWILVTHIHLDHAGAAGTIARRFPSAKVGVHKVGAPHLVDPAKLWSSATRIYGDDMERLWGGIDPLPGDRIQALGDGDKIDLGGRVLQAVETPGHAYHHHAFLDDSTGTVFAGDALGVRLPDVPIVRPATPPPEFHLEKAIASIDRLRELRPDSMCLTHYGPARDVTVDEMSDAAIEGLRQWGQWVELARKETGDLDRAAELVRERARASYQDSLSEEAVTRLEQTTSNWMNTWGYMRYFDKRAEKGS